MALVVPATKTKTTGFYSLMLEHQQTDISILFMLCASGFKIIVVLLNVR